MHISVPSRSDSGSNNHQKTQFSLTDIASNLKSNVLNENERKINHHFISQINQNTFRRSIKKKIFKLKKLKKLKKLSKGARMKRFKYKKEKKYCPPTPYNTTEFICSNQSFSSNDDFSSTIQIYPSILDLDRKSVV